jgi:2,3-bisphosphoglycerate-independent phosphoglycerate mutase
MNNKKSPLVLCILDGWGISPTHDNNAILSAHLPNWNAWLKTCPNTKLEASGESVGLPKGQMGNSEVGHTTIGAGRVMMQDLPRITHAFETNSVEMMPGFQSFLKNLKKSTGVCHVLGLLSPGGIHSHQSHIEGFLELLHKNGIKTHLHCFLDGRDTPPQSAATFLNALKMPVATMMGRFYGMDRDSRWDRTEKAFEAIVNGRGERALNPIDALQSSYEQNTNDEFILPTIFGDYQGIQPGDGLLMVNFRADRVKQLLAAFLLDDFTGFKRSKKPAFSATLGMKSYSATLDSVMPSLFPQEQPLETLGAIIEENGMRQLRAAETEKYAHVTFFFNGGKETPYPHEDRLLVPSPKIQTYDLQPEMSAVSLTNQVIEKLETGLYDFVVLNFANPDMVGHTGNFNATVKAVETVDACLGRLAKCLQEMGGKLVITADHGNAEHMDEKGTPYTAHTTNLVPFVLVGFSDTLTLKPQGELRDIAPTILSLMQLKIPKEMTGCSLIS